MSKHTSFKKLEEKYFDDYWMNYASLRGWLGALQKTRINTSLDNMPDSIIVDEDVRSPTADVEFAAESSNLTR